MVGYVAGRSGYGFSIRRAVLPCFRLLAVQCINRSLDCRNGIPGSLYSFALFGLRSTTIPSGSTRRIKRSIKSFKQIIKMTFQVSNASFVDEVRLKTFFRTDFNFSSGSL